MSIEDSIVEIEQFIEELEQNIETAKRIRRELIHIAFNSRIDEQLEGEIENTVLICNAFIERWTGWLEGEALH